MKRLFAFTVITALIAIWAMTLSNEIVQGSPNALPEVVYLGDSGTFTVPAGYKFIVKRLGPFRFELEPGTTYTAVGVEHVWQTSGDTVAPPPAYHTEQILGSVQAGCVIDYLILDDDIPGRRNHFSINGIIVHTAPEEMVSSGSFVAGEDGILAYIANDSSGLYVEFCTAETPTPTATATNTASPTATATLEPTATVEPTATATVEATMEATTEATATSTATPDGTTTPTIEPSATPTLIATATATLAPTFTPTPTAEPTSTTGVVTITPVATPTNEPRLNACTRINFEVTGDSAFAGTYSVHEFGGRHLIDWTAADGWQDSGWIHDIDISYPAVFVDVYFHPANGGSLVKMVIANHAPDTTGGWMSRGECHALEVGWPDGYTPEPPADNGEAPPAIPTTESTWPDAEPTVTPTRSPSLSG